MPLREASAMYPLQHNLSSKARHGGKCIHCLQQRVHHHVPSTLQCRTRSECRARLAFLLAQETRRGSERRKREVVQKDSCFERTIRPTISEHCSHGLMRPRVTAYPNARGTCGTKKKKPTDMSWQDLSVHDVDKTHPRPPTAACTTCRRGEQS